MTSIRILPDRVANQIAAGEVIERPAAVIKELLENSLDAGATRVEVEFRQGGRSYMRVEDNGSGMRRDDALLALERHATSKIREADDLDLVASFGFRGEALPSIASVSRFLIRTREAGEETGSEILVNGGKILHVRDCGMPPGTRIEVSHLFNSVPARRKFLKTDNTETGHIVHCARLYALAHPQIAFTLIDGGRVLFQSPPCSELNERIGEIFGEKVLDNLLPIGAAEADLRLSGYVGKPGVGRSTRHEMITFVNRRPVENRTLSYALLESYHSSLSKGRYPLAFLFLDIDSRGVDVNVHPAKREIRFREEGRVRRFVIGAVLKRLESGSSPEAAGSGSAAGPDPEPGEPAAGSRGAAPPAPIPMPGAFSTQPRASPKTGVAARSGGLPPAPAPTVAAGDGPEAKGRGFSVDSPGGAAEGWRFLGLAHGRYAVFETGAGLVLLDRRAAHERVAYEEILDHYQKEKPPAQSLLFPVPLEVDALGAAVLENHREFLKATGFEVEPFGRNFFRVESVPVWVDPERVEPFLRDLIGLMRDGNLPESQPSLARDTIARLAACRAVRISDSATEAEMTGLVGRLLACRQPLTNPRGRPAFVEISRGELDRRFQKR